MYAVIRPAQRALAYLRDARRRLAASGRLIGRRKAAAGSGDVRVAGETAEGRQPVLLPLLGRLPPGARVLLAALFLSAAVGAGYAGYRSYPDGRPPRDEEAERQIFEFFGVPEDSDNELQGDFLIERFYILDEQGQRLVADLCKGRVSAVNHRLRRDWNGSYSVVLQRKGLQPRADLLTTLMKGDAPVREDVKYLGVKVQAGDSETFPVNYDGTALAPRHHFRGPKGEDVYTYLSGVNFDELTASGARLLARKGTNFLLSNTALFPYLRAEFGLSKAVFISQLIFLDGSRLP